MQYCSQKIAWQGIYTTDFISMYAEEKISENINYKQWEGGREREEVGKNQSI